MSSKVVTNAISQLLAALVKHTEAPRRGGGPGVDTEAAVSSLVANITVGRAHAPAGPAGGAAPSSALDARHDGGRGRSQEAALAACACLRELCSNARAMRPSVLIVLCASAPLLCRHQPERVQAEALSLCRRLASLAADATWLFFICALPPSERWLAKPPAGCPRLSTASLLECPVPHAEIAPNARRMLDVVHAMDSSQALAGAHALET